MRDILRPVAEGGRHKSRIGFKIMGLFSDGKRVLSCHVPDVDFRSGAKDVTNPNGKSFTNQLIQLGINQSDLPRLHSETAALENITNSIDPNVVISGGSVLNQQLQAVKTNNPKIPLRVKFYIRNSDYPPCIKEYNPPDETQKEAPCNRYLDTFIRNFAQQYGVDARMKVASPGGVSGIDGTKRKNTRVRYGYDFRDRLSDYNKLRPMFPFSSMEYQVRCKNGKVEKVYNRVKDVDEDGKELIKLSFPAYWV